MQHNRLFWKGRRNKDRRERQNVGLFKNDTSIEWSMMITANSLSIFKTKVVNYQKEGLGLGAQSIRMTATMRQVYTREIKGLIGTPNLQE